MQWPVENGFGFYGQIGQTDDLVECHICGELKKTLGSHVLTHGTTMKEYKLRFRLKGVRLVAVNMHEKYRLGVETGAYPPNKRGDNLKNLQFKTKPTPPITKEEIIVRLKHLAEVLGRTPTTAEYDSYYRTSYRPMKAVFGSFPNALMASGFAPNNSSKPKYTKEILLQALRDYYKNNGRRPTLGNIKGILPGSTTYRRFFGTWEEALEQAFTKEKS